MSPVGVRTIIYFISQGEVVIIISRIGYLGYNELILFSVRVLELLLMNISKAIFYIN